MNLKNLLLAGVVAVGCAVTVFGAGVQFGTVPVPAAFVGSLTNATLTATTAVAIPVPPGADLILWPQFSGAGGQSMAAAQGTNVVYGFDVSDGNVYTTTYPLLTTNYVNTNVTVVAEYIIPKASLTGAKFVRWDFFSTTSTNGVTPAAMDYSWVGN